MYKILKEENSRPISEEKWSPIVNNNNFEWKNIYRLPFITTKNSKLQWLQYRITHRILGTNEFLNKINLIPSNKCEFCKESVETIEHIFWSCTKVFDLWENLNQWIRIKQK